MAVKAENVSKHYHTQKALDNVNFTLKQGQIVGFIGPNGAGKSTMMKIICGLIPASEGKVFVNGHEVKEDNIELRRNIGYLPENNPLYYDMFVKEYLKFTAGMYHVSNISARIKEVVEQTGLGTEQHKKIGALSKGYKQRVGLAQAIIHNPTLLILDEPTTGLDPNQIVEIRNLITSMGREKTVLLSTHIMQEVEAICDRVMIINKGKIVADDVPSRVGEQKQGARVVLVEFDQSIEPVQLESLKGVTKVLRVDEKQFLVESPASIDIRGDLFTFAVSKGIKVLSMNEQKQNLEEAFRNLTL